MIELIQEKWNEILERMRTDYDISEIAYNTWIKPLTAYSETNHEITIVYNGDNYSIVDMIKRKYGDFLTVALSEYFNDTFTIKILTLDELAKLKASQSVPARTREPVNVISENYTGHLNPNYTFDTFVVGKNNEMAHATALAVADGPGEYGNPLFIYGGVGLGKTHLMNAIAYYVLQKNPGARLLFTTSEEFSTELIFAIRNKTQEAFKKKYRNIDMLLIDDIQFIAGRDSTQEEFFHTFNTLYENKKQIVISSDKPPKDIVNIEERLVSRFKIGLTVDVQPPDYETRVAILSQRASLEHLDIDTDSLHYVADNISSNIRELEGAIKQIGNYARLKRVTKIDLNLVKEALKNLISPEEIKQITPEIIIGTVAEHFSITPEDILGQKRNRDIAYPRQVCMYICKKKTELSLQAIGQALGGRDHTTIMHGAEKIEKEVKNDAALKDAVDIIIKKMNSPK